MQRYSEFRILMKQSISAGELLDLIVLSGGACVGCNLVALASAVRAMLNDCNHPTPSAAWSPPHPFRGTQIVKFERRSPRRKSPSAKHKRSISVDHLPFPPLITAHRGPCRIHRCHYTSFGLAASTSPWRSNSTMATPSLGGALGHAPKDRETNDMRGIMRVRPSTSVTGTRSTNEKQD